MWRGREGRRNGGWENWYEKEGNGKEEKGEKATLIRGTRKVCRLKERES